MKASPEQIAQWKKAYEKWADANESLHRNPYEIFVAGRQAAFDEYSKQLEKKDKEIKELREWRNAKLKNELENHGSSGDL